MCVSYLCIYRCRYKVPTTNTQNVLHWLLDYATTHIFQMIQLYATSGYDMDDVLMYYTLYLYEYCDYHLSTCISTSIYNIYMTMNQFFPLIDKRLLSCSIFTSTTMAVNNTNNNQSTYHNSRITSEQSYESNLFLLLLLLLNSVCNKDFELDMADDGVNNSVIGSQLIHITLVSGKVIYMCYVYYLYMSVINI